MHTPVAGPGRPALGLILLLVLGCGGPPADAQPGEPLLVMAAASLNQAMPALIAEFEAQGGGPVDLALGATGNLAAQITNGAPADLFFSADETTVERLAGGGLIVPTSVDVYAVGELVLVWRAATPRPGSLLDLAQPSYEVIAIANPETAPYGAAAREVLRRLGIWETVEPRIVQGESVTQAYQFVQTGNADVALVARSLVDAGADVLQVDPALHTHIRQAAGVLTRSVHPGATAFLESVLSEEGQAILADHGFAPPR